MWERLRIRGRDRGIDVPRTTEGSKFVGIVFSVVKFFDRVRGKISNGVLDRHCRVRTVA